ARSSRRDSKMKTTVDSIQSTKASPTRTGTGARVPDVSATARVNPGTKSPPPALIRVLLADDHPVVRKGLSSCLAQAKHISIVGEATNGQEALRKAKELLPDLVLMDIDMPLLNGLTAADILRKENPSIKVLILSMHNDSDYVMRILQSGARGYVL